MTKSKKQAKANKTQAKVAKLTIKGAGDYTPADRAALKDIQKRLAELDSRVPKLKNVGRGIGSMFGLGDLGEKAGDYMSQLFGMGDYRLKTNSLMSIGDLPQNVVPVFSRDGKRGVRVTEREFIGEVTSGQLASGSSVFTNNVFRLNPADVATFPWLSTIAKQFEQWEPHGIVFEFVSTSSEFNGTSQALGTVIMGTDYDPYDSPAVNKIQLENYDYSNSTKPSLSAMHGIECDPSERATRLLYTDAAGDFGDKRFSVLGNFQCATVGCSTANAVLGELWISYDITFYKKQLGDVYGNNALALQVVSTSISTATSLLGTATVVTGSSPSFKVSQIIGTGTRIYFPPAQMSGRYLVVWTCESSHTVQLDFSGVSVSGGSKLVAKAAFLDESTLVTTYLALVALTAPGAYILFPLANTGASDVACTVSAVPDDFILT